MDVAMALAVDTTVAIAPALAVVMDMAVATCHFATDNAIPFAANH